MSYVSFDEYLVRVMLALDHEKTLRLGQTYFNVLADVRPDIVERYIQGTDLDPFHDSRRLAPFLAEVYKRW